MEYNWMFTLSAFQITCYIQHNYEKMIRSVYEPAWTCSKIANNVLIIYCRLDRTGRGLFWVIVNNLDMWALFRRCRKDFCCFKHLTINSRLCEAIWKSLYIKSWKLMFSCTDIWQEEKQLSRAIFSPKITRKAPDKLSKDVVRFSTKLLYYFL